MAGTVDWSACGPSASCPTSMSNGSMLVGLTFIGTQFELMLAGAQIAGTRINTDGTSVIGGQRWSVELAGGGTVLGPGNVIGGVYPWRIRVFGGAGDITIFDNGIGYDVLTHQVFESSLAFDLRGGAGAIPVVVSNNVIAAQSVVSTTFFGSSYEVRFARNRIGVDPLGRQLGGMLGGFMASQGTLVVGPDNILEGLSSAASISGGNVTITQNRITGNVAGIVYTSTPPVAAPVISLATPSSIGGTCTSGTVEVFTDAGDQGEQFLDQAPCASGTFAITGSFPAGRNATATETISTGTSTFSAPVPIQ